MNNVLMHFIACQNRVPILKNKNSTNQIGQLSYGEWMGVRKIEGAYYEVLTFYRFGRVKIANCKSFITLELSVSQESNGITYLAA